MRSRTRPPGGRPRIGASRVAELDALRGLAVVGMMLQHNLWFEGWYSILGELPAVVFVATLGAGAGLRHVSRRAQRTREGFGVIGPSVGALGRFVGLLALHGALTTFDGPIAVVLGVLGVTGLLLEPLVLVSDRAAVAWVCAVAVVAFGLRVAPSLWRTAGVGDSPWPDVVMSFVTIVNAAPYPLTVWLVHAGCGYLLGRYWHRIRTSTRVLAGSFLGACSTAGVAVVLGHRAAAVDTSVVFAQHQLWEWDHFPGDGLGLPVELASRLIPYSGSLSMVTVSASVSLLALVLLRVLTCGQLGSALAQPFALLGRVALTAYVVHVVWSARCMDAADLTWRCSADEGRPFVVAQLVLVLTVALMWRAADLAATGPVELVLRLPEQIARAVALRWVVGRRRAGSEPGRSMNEPQGEAEPQAQRPGPLVTSRGASGSSGSG